MKLDMSKFKKVHEGEQSVILQHPDGHKIAIHKQMLSPKQKEDVSRLRLYKADGTTQDDMTDQLLSDAEKRISDKAKSQGLAEERDRSVADQMPNFPDAKPVQMADNRQPQVIINNTPPPQQPQQVAQAQPQVDQRFNPVNPSMGQSVAQSAPDPYGANAYANISKEGLLNQIQGINETAKAQNEQNMAVAKERDLGAEQQQNVLNNVNQNIQKIRDEHQAVVQDALNNHIDPNHYLNSMGTGQKIATAIGLILGGMSSGFTHQGNPALEFLQKQIANDIEGQRLQIGKSQNLLSAYSQMFGNEVSGAQMTMAVQNSIIANRIESAALKTGNPVLIARAKQAAGELESKNAGLFSQIAVRQSLAGGGGGQPGQAGQQSKAPQIAPAEQVRMLGMSGILGDDDKKKAYEELGKKEEAESLRSQLIDSYKDLNSKWLGGTFSPADRASAIQAIAGKLAKVSEGRFNLEESKQQIDAFLPRRLESDETTKNKLQRLNNFIDGLVQTPVLDAYHIGRQAPVVKKEPVAEGPPVLK